MSLATRLDKLEAAIARPRWPRDPPDEPRVSELWATSRPHVHRRSQTHVVGGVRKGSVGAAMMPHEREVREAETIR
jgi:hypothetical protein